MREYLLGRLTGEASEQMDERFVTDAEFAALLSDAEYDLVDSYINGELSPEDHRQFESFYLATPARREKITVARSFNQFANKHRVKSVSASASSGLFSTLMAAFTSPAFRLGAAALVVVLAGSFWYLRKASRGVEVAESANALRLNQNDESNAINSDNANSGARENRNVALSNEQLVLLETNNSVRSQNDNRKARQTRSIVAFVLPPPVRGTDLKTLVIPPDTAAVSFTLELDAYEHKSYRVVLQTEGREVWRSGTTRFVIRSGLPSIEIRIPVNLLTAKIYSFTVSGTRADGSSEIIGGYDFRVLR